ncbi:MAG: UDP-N-acetylmuramoyl-L-alanine--D-glutamate ligase [Acetobacteraceae bacterium]|nr:UDP-N-acetylmuramoyl-L-alanine--D-glutamate ligase [Acetobacteraceae bacterium]
MSGTRRNLPLPPGEGRGEGGTAWTALTQPSPGGRGLFAGERYAVVGLGRNGLPVAHALAAMGAEIAVWDDRADARADAPFPLRTPAQGYRGFTALVLSPGIPHRLPVPHPAALAAAEAGIPIVSDAELLYQATRRRRSGARFVGVTGTNGKSTTTALLHHILVSAGWDSAAGGNLGTPALALPVLGDEGVYVLEMSSYMLERVATLRFDAAALLNLSPDHMDRHGDMPGYVAAKLHIFDRQSAGQAAVFGIDDAETEALAGPDAITISGHRPADYWCDDGLLRTPDGPLVRLEEAPALPGSHNAQNAAAAAALATALGVPREAIADGIRTFPGLPHRQQLVATIDGVAWVNDSKATNADAAARALACYDRVVWIAGGEAKEGGIAPLRPLFPRIAHALLIGRDAHLLAATLAEAAVPHTITGTLEQAVPQAGHLAREAGAQAVLLSPACASFDQFPGFEARGDRFAALARAALREPA